MGCGLLQVIDQLMYPPHVTMPGEAEPPVWGLVRPATGERCRKLRRWRNLPISRELLHFSDEMLSEGASVQMPSESESFDSKPGALRNWRHKESCSTSGALHRALCVERRKESCSAC